MENKFRNEMTITLGDEKILLRPTFENVAAMEANVGSVSWLGWKFSRGVRLGKDNKPESIDMEATVRSLPSLSETAKIIYFNQAVTKEGDPSAKKFSIDEIWQFVMDAGTPATKQVVQFLARITAGNRAMDDEEVTEGEKKS